VGVCGCVCVCVCPCRRASQRSSLATDRAHPPPRTRRAFVDSRWNTYAARRREAPSRTARAPFPHPGCKGVFVLPHLGGERDRSGR
jgi:hypothetical protein